MMEVPCTEVAVSSPSALGECPWWDAPRRRVIWVDIEGGLLHSYTPNEDSAASFPAGETVSFVVGRRSGGFLAGTATGLVAFDADLARGKYVGSPPDLGDRRRRCNDGICDPAGRVLFGTMDPRGSMAGTLWSYAGGQRFTPIATGVGMSNGLGFSMDGRSLYFVDSAERRVDHFDYDAESGVARNRRPWYRVPSGDGVPDGLAIDECGCVWVALWGAGEVRRLDEAGVQVGSVRVPTPKASSCAFGGTCRETLYVTSAMERQHGEEWSGDTLAGKLFAADVGVSGATVWEAAV